MMRLQRGRPLAATASAVPDGVVIERRTQLLSSRIAGAWVIMVMNVLDVITTTLVLEKGGGETNPIASFLIEYRLLWFLKVLIPVWILVFTYIGRARRDRVVERLYAAVWFIAGLYSMIVVSNTMVLLFRY
jgi:hypothetical protein